MRNIFWCIQNSKTGKIDYTTLRVLKRDAISAFVMDPSGKTATITWVDAQEKYGWVAVKVKLIKVK